MDLKETHILGHRIAEHWYYRSKIKAMTHLLGARQARIVLDIGAGSGVFSRHLLATTDAREAWCIDISYDADSETTETGKPVRFRRAIDRVDADLVLMMDVLEHVDDDVALVRHYADKVPRGAVFLLSVPAFQSLWSEHDTYLEHRRRYRLAQIEDVARRAGLHVCCGAYFFGAVFPIAATVRIMKNRWGRHHRSPRSQLRPHGRVVNGALAAVSHAELRLMRYNRLAGLTAFCLAENR